MSRTGKVGGWMRLKLYVCTACDHWFKDMGKRISCPRCGTQLAS